MADITANGSAELQARADDVTKLSAIGDCQRALMKTISTALAVLIKNQIDNNKLQELVTFLKKGAKGDPANGLSLANALCKKLETIHAASELMALPIDTLAPPNIVSELRTAAKNLDYLIETLSNAAP
eukprot:8577682-Pyramimonas_sp.AAC.1